MSERDETNTTENQSVAEAEEDNPRVAEQGEADEPDAPTAAEENEGMNTIMGVGPMTGVQDNASEE